MWRRGPEFEPPTSGCVATIRLDRRFLAPLAQQHGAAQLRDSQHIPGRCDRLQRVRGFGIERHVEHRPKRLAGRERHLELEHEAVQLRFGQRVGSFELDRVLRRQHAERARQAMGNACVRHLPLLHGFEQGRLACGASRD